MASMQESAHLGSGLEGEEPEVLWKIFDDISRIPRPSKREDRVLKYIETFAKQYDFETKTDAAGNLRVKVPATPGYKDRPVVCLQGHADMVCVAQDGVKHDFENESIQLVRDGDFLKADGTSLGADNGIGIAAALTIATDPSAVHPPLEILVTRDEEAGMSGAENFDAKELDMKSTILLNLDTETLGEVYISSAGLMTVTGERVMLRDPPPEDKPYLYFRVTLSGMPGGHSGVDIDKNHGNAILALGNFLRILPRDIRLVSIDGGQKMNAIPTGAQAIILVPDTLNSVFNSAVMHFEIFLDPRWKNANVKVEEVPREQVTVNVMRDTTHEAILRVFGKALNGIARWSRHVPGLVESSSNFGVIKTNDIRMHVEFSTRSDDQATMEDLANDLGRVLLDANFNREIKLGAPSWKGDPNSPLIQSVGDAYEKVSGGAQRAIRGIHGGLEIVYVVDSLKDATGQEVAAATFGPTIIGAHGPTEKVDIPSVNVFYEQLKEVLRQIAEDHTRFTP